MNNKTKYLNNIIIKSLIVAKIILIRINFKSYKNYMKNSFFINHKESINYKNFYYINNN